MNREELIEALAAIEHSRATGGESIEACDHCRDHARSFVPVIVEFVAEWLRDASCDDFDFGIPEKLWREEMGAK